MGSLNVLNVLGSPAKITQLQVNNTPLISQPVTLQQGGTSSGISSPSELASSFQGFIMQITYSEVEYQINLNREHWFGDNDGSYPGSNYDNLLILQGFSGSNIQLMLVYRANANVHYEFSNDTSKQMNAVS